MLIESKIRREGGSRIDIGGVIYHFKPQGDDPAHVCDVSDEEAVARFLAIPEGYKLVKAPAAARATVQDKEEDDEGSLVIKKGDERVDLAIMTKKQLVDFAKEEGFEIDPHAKVDELRADIYKLATE